MRDFLDTTQDFIRRVWIFLKSVASIVSKSRFSLIIVLLAVISLEFVGQIKDILVGLNHPESSLQIAFFILAVNWLAFQSWGWARFIYSRCYADEAGLRGEEGHQRFLINWLPRIYALVAFVAAYRAAIRAHVDSIANGIILVGLLVMALLIYRSRLVSMTQSMLKYAPNRSHHHFTAIVMIVTSGFAVVSPVDFGNLLGAGAVVFLGLGSIIPVGTLGVYATRENGFPVVGAALLWAVLISPLTDNHHVREIENVKSNTQQYSLAQNLEQWNKQAVPDKPMVLVATAGGGLRASYWTGVILGRFQDKIPGFNQQVFAISGVSGGSVGAMFYTAALTSKPVCRDKNKSVCFEDNLLNAIGRDYLAPTATSMLYGDLMQRFIPYPFIPDRATALEESWEVGFADAYPDSNASCGLADDFMDFFVGDCVPKNQWSPLLLFNGTYEESGKRLITTSFQVEPDTFLDTHEFYQLNDQAALRASTAALNSARFTYVSPAGTFGPENKNVGHVIDGGYFENYGAMTLINLINWLRLNDKQFPQRQLIVIAISNDSEVPLQQYRLDAVPDRAKSQSFLNEVLAPVIGLANTRSGHGMLAYKLLAQDVEEKNINEKTMMSHFYLEKNDDQPPPLGWILSEQSKNNMRQQISDQHNCKAYKDILRSFGADSDEC